MSNVTKIEVEETSPNRWTEITPSTQFHYVSKTNKNNDKNEYKANHFIGGLDEELTALREIIKLPFLYEEVFEHLKIEPPKGILLKGVTGVGKTLLVHCIAQECGAELFVVNGPEILGTYVGDSEQQLRDVFDKASAVVDKPSIIFIDEIVI